MIIDDLAQPCPVRQVGPVIGLPHCWHDMRDPDQYTTTPRLVPHAPEQETKISVEVCCFCKGKREVWLRRGRDPAHGPHHPSGDMMLYEIYRPVKL